MSNMKELYELLEEASGLFKEVCGGDENEISLEDTMFNDYGQVELIADIARWLRDCERLMRYEREGWELA